jgi:hypothetical protein
MSVPLFNNNIANECLKKWKTISLENDYRIEEAKRKWLGNSKKRFSFIVNATKEITVLSKCSVTKSLAWQLPKAKR